MTSNEINVLEKLTIVSVSLFSQSICDDPKVLAQNYALKLNNDDYKQMDHQKAIEDFKDRVKAYELVYEVSSQHVHFFALDSTATLFQLSPN